MSAPSFLRVPSGSLDETATAQSNRNFTALSLVLVTAVFVLVGLDKISEATDLAYEDTMTYLEGALFIKEHEGMGNFLNLALTGQYKIAEQQPLYLLLLSPFAERDLAFFPKAKLVSLAAGGLVVISVFLMVADLFGPTAAFLAAVFLALNEEFVTRSSHVAVESTLLLFVVLSWYFIVKGFDDHRLWIAAGIFSGLAYLTKGTGILLVPVFTLSTLLVLKRDLLRSKCFWLFFVSFMVVSSPLIIRNVVVYKNPLYQGLLSHTPWLEKWEDLSNPQHTLVMNYPELTYTFRNLPTMSSYLQAHSIAEIGIRLIKGITGEGRVLTNAMAPIIPPFWQKQLGVLLCLFALLGLLWDRGKRRGTLTMLAILVFFLPFAWGFQLFALPRYLSPIIPWLCIYAPVGLLVLVRFLDRQFLPGHVRVNVSSALVFIMTCALIFIAGYEASTQQVSSFMDPPVLSEDQQDLVAWLKDNVKEKGVVVLGPTHHYWGLLWYAGFRGKFVPTGGMAPYRHDSLHGYMKFLKERRVNFIILHQENWFSPALLKDYFHWDDRIGLVQRQPVPGWTLVYKYPRKPMQPAKFLVYRISHAEDNAEPTIEPPEPAIDSQRDRGSGK